MFKCNRRGGRETQALDTSAIMGNATVVARTRQYNKRREATRLYNGQFRYKEDHYVNAFTLIPGKCRVRGERPTEAKVLTICRLLRPTKRLAVDDKCREMVEL